MSVYGGLATRQIESKYNMVLYNLIFLLQYRIQRLYDGEVVHERHF